TAHPRAPDDGDHARYCRRLRRAGSAGTIARSARAARCVDNAQNRVVTKPALSPLAWAVLGALHTSFLDQTSSPAIRKALAELEHEGFARSGRITPGG